MAIKASDTRCSVPKCRAQNAEHVLFDVSNKPFRFCSDCAPTYHAAGYRRQDEEPARFNYRKDGTA